MNIKLSIICHVFLCLLVQKSRVALKAFESLLLLVSIPKEDTAVCLAESTPLCQLLAERLCELFSQLPATLEPADIHSFPQTHWK